MSSNNEIQSLFTLLLDSVLSKVSREHKINLDEIKDSIGTITFTEDLSDSINSFCNILNPIGGSKPKRVLKKVVSAVQASKVTEVITSSPGEPETVVETPKPKKVVKKAVSTTQAPKEPEVIAEPPKEPEVIAEAPKPKKVVKKAVSTTQAPKEPEVIAEPPKPKKVVKKAVSTTQAPKEPEVIAEAPKESEVVVEAPKPKQVVKKAFPVVNPLKEPEVVAEVVAEVPKESEVVVEEPEVKIKPKKIIVKRLPVEAVKIPEPPKMSKKEVDVVEYGSDEQHDENASVYDSIQMYEDDLLEPREINGVKYLIDSSEYIYDMESQELLGKLSEKDKSTILFLKNFSE
jgi:hypothetical protein